MSYRVGLTIRAQRELDELPQHIQRRVLRWLDLLADDPRRPGSKKLAGHEALHRIHASRDYVIVYAIRDKEVLVLIVRVAPRKDVYRGL